MVRLDHSQHRGNRLQTGKHVEVKRFLAADHRWSMHRQTEALVQQLHRAVQWNAAHLIKQRLRKVPAVFQHGFGPRNKVQRHRIGNRAVKVEQVGGVRAGRQGKGHQVNNP